MGPLIEVRTGTSSYHTQMSPLRHLWGSAVEFTVVFSPNTGYSPHSHPCPLSCVFPGTPHPVRDKGRAALTSSDMKEPRGVPGMVSSPALSSPLSPGSLLSPRALSIISPGHRHSETSVKTATGNYHCMHPLQTIHARASRLWKGLFSSAPALRSPSQQT